MGYELVTQQKVPMTAVTQLAIANKEVAHVRSAPSYLTYSLIKELHDKHIELGVHRIRAGQLCATNIDCFRQSLSLYFPFVFPIQTF